MYYPQQPQQPQQQQPQHRQYPSDWYDQSTLLQGLPGSNNVVPQINVYPTLPQNVAWEVASDLRMFFQQSLSKGPVQIVAYNMMSENHFQNQAFQAAVQTAADLTAYIMLNDRMDYPTARRKAVRAVYMGNVAMAFATHQWLQSQVPPQFIQEIQTASGLYRQALQDTQALWQRQAPAPVGGQYNQGGYGSGHVPPPQVIQPQQGGYGGYPMHGGQYPQQAMPVAPPHHQMASQQVPNGPRIQTTAPQSSMPGNSKPNDETGRYRDWSLTQSDSTTRQPGQPIQSFTTAPTPVASETAGWKPPAMNNNNTPTTPTPAPVPATNLDDLDVYIKDESDLVLDPYYHIPEGVEIDKERPYDIIHAPHGIQMVPAFLSPYKATLSDYAQYSTGYQPDIYCMYHVVWADGTVQEVPYEWKDGMEYLKHQLLTELKGVDVPDGKVIPSSRIIQRTASVPVPATSLMSDDIDHQHLKKSPVVIDGVFTTSTPMEDEELAQQHLMESLDLDEGDTIPAHIYTTMQSYPLNVSEECSDRLYLLAASDDLLEIAHGLQKAVKDGVLPLREFRLINDRFTALINKALVDHLSIDDLKVHSFVNDTEELFEILQTEKEYLGIYELIQGRTSWFADRALALQTEAVQDDEADDRKEDAEDGTAPEHHPDDVPTLTDAEGWDDTDETDEVLDDAVDAAGVVFLSDFQVNYRVGFLLEELAALKLGHDAVLISKAGMPRLHEVISKFTGWYTKATIQPGELYIITADGAYLEVITGWLNSGTALLKRVR